MTKFTAQSGFTVAIDGPAAAGKGTIASAVAQAFGFAHLDTGLLYRAVGAQMLTGKDPLDAAQSLDPSALEKTNLRTAQVAEAASKVAAISDVRATLVDFQRAFARRIGGAVLDGRDIGTVICPEAEVKLFVTASPAVRAERRFAELTTRGVDTSLEKVLSDVKARDTRDQQRSTAPLMEAEDATRLDTSTLSIDEATQAAIHLVTHALRAASVSD